MPAFFVKSDGATLRPTCRAAALEIDKLARGIPLKVEPRQPRNGKQHRLYWAFASLVADCLNDGPTTGDWTQEDASNHMKLATGRCEIRKLGKRDRERLGVDYAAVPKSISFAAMDGQEFGKFMTAAFAYVRDDLCPWIEDSDHWADIETILRESRMLGEKAA